MYAPAEIDGKTYRVKLTVKDYTLTDGAERQNLHAIETVEIENAPMGTLPSIVDKQWRAQPTSERAISITDLMRGATRNDGLAFDTNQTRNSQAQNRAGNRADIQRKINEYRAAISGSLKNHADNVNVVSRDEIVRPENAQDLMNVEGFYNPKDGKITLIAESLRDSNHARFVAWHELAHRKIDVSGAADWHKEIKRAGNHSTVKQLADKIQAQRKDTDDTAATNRAIANEEAIAELYAAHETGDYAALEKKYGIKIPRALKNNLGGFLSRLGERLANVWRKITGQSSTSGADVFNLLKTLSRANDTTAAQNSVSGSLNQKRSSNADRTAYDQAKADGRTELTFAQWQQVRTPEFKAWFGDWENDPENASKVINPKTGEPLVVYHYTPEQFNIFDLNKARQYSDVPAFFFTTDPEMGMEYGDNEMQVFLNIRNMTEKPMITSDKDGKALRDELIAQGFDGTIVDDSYGDYLNIEYAALYSNQIKSATDNIGTFDPNNDDIRYSLNEKTPVYNDDEKAEILQGEPVYIITQRNAPRNNADLKQWATELFNQAGNKAVNPEIGEVALTAKSVKDSLAHGLNPHKAAAFEAVSSVIEKGVVIAETQHGNLTSYFISAPVQIENTDDIVTVLVRKDMNTQRMYLHSVISKENLLNKVLDGATADSTADNQPRGKLYSGDIASVLQKYLNRKIGVSGSLKNDNGIRYSRGTTPAQVAQFTQTAQITNDPTLWQALRGDRTADYLAGKKTTLGKVQDWLIEGFADHLHPVSKWIDSLPVAEQTRELFKQSMYRAGGMRDYQNEIITQQFIEPMTAELRRIAKANKLGFVETKRLIGYWGSANYAPIANARLLQRDKDALDQARANGASQAEIARLQQAYNDRQAAAV